MTPTYDRHARTLNVAAMMTRDPYPAPDYRVCLTPQDLDAYLGATPVHHFLPYPLIAEDTESLPDGSPFCWTFSHTPGTARLCYFTHRTMVEVYRDWLERANPLQLFHNYLHDKEPFDLFNFPVPNNRFLDTMVRAYNLCLGGGGDEDDGESRAGRGLLSLKVLAYRHCQMRMQNFADVVFPHSLFHARRWLDLAQKMLTPGAPVKFCICGHPRHNHLPRGKTGKTVARCGVMLCTCEKYKLGKAVKTQEDKQIQ